MTDDDPDATARAVQRMQFKPRLPWFDAVKLKRGDITQEQADCIAEATMKSDIERFVGTLMEARAARQRNREWLGIV